MHTTLFLVTHPLSLNFSISIPSPSLGLSRQIKWIIPAPLNPKMLDQDLAAAKQAPLCVSNTHRSIVHKVLQVAQSTLSILAVSKTKQEQQSSKIFVTG